MECNTCGYSSKHCTCDPEFNKGFSPEAIQMAMKNEIRRKSYTASHSFHIMSKVGKRVRPLPGMTVDPTKGYGWKLTQAVQ